MARLHIKTCMRSYETIYPKYPQVGNMYKQRLDRHFKGSVILITYRIGQRWSLIFKTW